MHIDIFRGRSLNTLVEDVRESLKTALSKQKVEALMKCHVQFIISTEKWQRDIEKNNYHLMCLGMT